MAETNVCNINDIASQLRTAARLVTSTDFFWVYTGDGTQVKIPAEFVRAYLTANIQPEVGDDGNWLIGGVDTGVKAEGVTPKLAADDLGINVSYDKGATWTTLVLYTQMDIGLEDLIATYKAIISTEQGRVDAEAGRQTAETERQEAERSRKEAESARVTEFAASKEAADDATAKALSTYSNPPYVDADGYYYKWNVSTVSYDKTDVNLTGKAFQIKKVFTSVAAMEATDADTFDENDFLLINTADTEDEDNAKLYVVAVDGSGKKYYSYLVDMSGFRGFTGKTPQFSIGTVSTLPAGSTASASVTADGTDADGNPKYKLNLAIPKGDKVTLADFTDEEIAELQKPATDAIALCDAATAKANTAASNADTATGKANTATDKANEAAADATAKATAASKLNDTVATAEAARVTAEKSRATAESERADAETKRATAESDRASAETARASAETKRASAETAREKAETTRQSQESTRQTNESTRKTNESARQTAETARASAETARANAESTRESNESARKTAESTRESNEATRKINETARKSNEETRQSNEETRMSNETARQSQETTRQSNEATRKSNETARTSNEDARKTAEASRVTAENARVTAEKSRASAETARASAETTRQSQEATRQSNETTRKNQESARVTAEAKRESDCAAAVANANDTAEHPTKVGTDNYVYTWDKTAQQYVKTNIYVKGDTGELNTFDITTLTPTSTFAKNVIVGINGTLYRSTKATSSLPITLVVENGQFVTETVDGKTAYVVSSETVNDGWEQFTDKAMEYWIASLNASLNGKADKATTLAGYGITDAKIANGVITLGSNTITPLTNHQSLADYAKTSDVTAEATRAKAREDAIEAVVNTINGSSSVDGSFRKAIADLIGGAPEALDTLKEIADKLAEDDDLHDAIEAAIALKADQTALDAVASRVTSLEGGSATMVTTTGTGNAVTSISKNGTTITATKGTTFLTQHQDISGKADKATTLAGYGITDAKIESGKITLGSSSITPLTSHQSLSGYAKTTDIPTKTSQLTNDSGYLTSHQDISGKSDNTHTHTVKINGTAKTIAATGGTAVDLGTYLTSHQSLDGYVNTVTTTGSGNAVTAISKSGKTVTVTKGSTFLTSHQDISGKANVADLTSHTGNTSNPHGVTKAQVGLGNVDNTSDASKPISTATQSALDLKLAKADASSTYLAKTDASSTYLSKTAASSTYQPKGNYVSTTDQYTAGGVTYTASDLLQAVANLMAKTIVTTD